MIRYTYLYVHNPKIDQRKETWKHTRCPDTYTNKAKLRVLDTETDSLEFENNSESVFSKCLLLDKIGLEDYENPSITLLDHSDKDQEIIAQVIVELFDKKSVKEVLDDDKDTSNQKSCVPKWAWEFGEVFSK